MKIKMDNDYNNQNINNSNDNASNSSSNSNNNYNLISSINTNTTNIADSASGSSSSSSSPLASIAASNLNTNNSNNNECQPVNYIEQLVQQQQQQPQPHHHQQIQFNTNKLATLARHHQMFDHFHHQHLQDNSNNNNNNKYSTNNRYGTMNGVCQYVDLNNPTNLPQQQPQTQTTQQQPHPPALPPPPMVHSNQPTTAYLVQTPNGSALLIPPQTGLNPSGHFIQTTQNQQAQQGTNTFSLNRNPYGVTTIPLQNTTILNNTTANPNLPNSPSLTSNNCFNRPESTASTNVYQTIDTEKNGYLYPLEGFYDGSTFSNTMANNTNNCSTRHKFKRNYQLQQQQQLQFQLQQQGQFVKLIESNNNSTNNNSSNTLRSNTNHTNSNFFVSPALSATSNRRHSSGSFFERLKYRLNKKLQVYCSWKCLAILFLFIILNLFTFTIYLAIMRMYNLNWHLKENTQTNSVISSKHQIHSQFSNDGKPSNSMFFSKIGDVIEDQILPLEFFNMQFYLDNSMYIKFNLSINKNSHIGIYADKGSPPTYTKFKIFETFDGNALITKTSNSNNLNKRALTNSQSITVLSNSMVNTGFVHYLEEGLWYFSLLNDNKVPLKFRLKTEFHEHKSTNCPMNCFGKGECVNGKCKCFPGFSGLDCSSNTCPVLCNGHGKYENGKCLCDTLWHGVECEIPIDQCEIPNCNKNGECLNGKCVCFPGYQGKFCEKQACLNPNCSNNGVCLNGKCVCFSNFTGSECNQFVKSTNSLCSNHGDFDYATKSCNCFKGWLGPDCSKYENCIDKSCNLCKNGWSGLNCQIRVPFSCDLRCNDHGICVNGTCNCSPGYQGRNCDINNCPNSCSSNGICERVSTSKYQCICNQGWTGKACDVAIEMVCNDEIDNDNDGLTDCMDSECCVFDNCKLSLACQTSPEPKDRLLRKQPPSLSATFFDKMRFLIEDGSVQSFAYSNTFSESQVSVIRGQVLFKNGQPLIGVKVSSVSNPSYGYTLTRNNGIFDLMINGGGSILLEFSRNRLKTRIVSVNAIWNQFVYIDPVVMYLSEDSNNLIQTSPCKVLMHDSSLVSPIVKTSWKEIRTYYYDNPLVLADSGVVRSEINIMDTNLKLVYSSNQAQGYSSTIFILLTQQTIPETLQLVHLQIIVEGVLHKQTFDAYSDLKYEYSWDRRNAYEQRVYGFTFAKVMIGYQYEGCSYIYWQSSIVKLAGYDLGSSEIGNWNIDVHHRLNTQQGILHKGDGTTIYLKEIQKTIEISAGQLKQKRDIECLQCNNLYQLDSTVKFYSPYSISINKDGLIFIADYNFIWMLNNTESPRAVLELKMDQPYKYYISNEPTNGNLYMTDSTKRQILSVKSLEQINDLKTNLKVAKGFCSSNNIECDINTSSKRVQYPKGLAFDNNGIMYFIDGNQIKSMNNDGIITTIIGNNDNNADAKVIYRPIGCNMTFSFYDIKFYWPTVLSINPVDNNLYVLDEEVVYKITSYNTVEIVAGLPYGCDGLSSNRFVKLNSPVDMAFNSDGDLYILENDQVKKIKQIRLVKSTGEVEVFYGEANLKNGAYSFDFDTTSFINFNDPIAIAVHQNRSVYVLDRGDNVLYHIKNMISRDEFTGKYTIVSPETKEAYIFNRFGLHMHTIDLLSGQMMYNFTYNGNALYGKLISVTDQNKMLLNIKRDFHGRAELMQTSSSLNIRLKLNNFDMLRSLSTSDNRSYNLNYMSNTGLLLSKTELNDKTTSFNYEKNGKVKEIIEPNNQITNISYYINSTGLVTVLNKGEYNIETWIVNSTAIYIYKNDVLESQIETSKSNFNMRTLSNEDSFNSFKIYFKSLFNFNKQSSINKLRSDGNFYYNNNRKITNANSNNNNRISKRDLQDLLENFVK